MIKKVSEFHDRIVEAVASLRGRDLSQAQILKAYAAVFPDRHEDLLQPHEPWPMCLFGDSQGNLQTHRLWQVPGPVEVHRSLADRIIEGNARLSDKGESNVSIDSHVTSMGADTQSTLTVFDANPRYDTPWK